MLNFSKFIFIGFILISSSLISQDVLYLNNGSKFEAVVKEITPNEVKYKNFNNPDGPTYVITKGDVLLIEYKTGAIDIINKNPQSLSPVKTEPVEIKKEEKKKDKVDLNYLNKNSLMINGVALANADITFLYDREFAKGHLSVTALGGYNFNKHTEWPNAYIQALKPSKKEYDIGLGVNFYPNVTRKAQYFVGILVKYMSYSYQREVIDSTYNATLGAYFYTSTFKPAQDYQLATMIVNGFQIRISPTIMYKLFVGLGGWSAHGDLRDALNTKNSPYYPSTQLKIYLGMCFGYRF